MSAWKDLSTGDSGALKSYTPGDYAKAAADIQIALNQGHKVDQGALDILEKAKYIGVAPKN